MLNKFNQMALFVEDLNWGVIIPSGIGIILLLVIIFSGYIKAPPDTAYIISGLRKKIIIGKASIRIPFFERVDKLKLQLIAVDVKTSSAVPTADYININVDANVNVKVSSDPNLIKLGAENFLNKDTAYVAKVAREVLEGNMREIVGQMSLEDMVNDRKAFAEKVQENAAPDLNRMGLEIVSFNVQNFTDDQNLIENLGIDNTTKIQKKAAIARLRPRKKPTTQRFSQRPRSLRKTMSLLSVRLNSKRKPTHSWLLQTLLTRSRKRNSVSPLRYQRLTLTSPLPKRTLSSRLARQR